MARPGQTEKVRHATDSGRTADKFPFPDPAAAPLGTDAEAADTPASAAAVEQDLAVATRPVKVRRLPDSFGVPVYTTVAAAAALALLAAVALA